MHNVRHLENDTNEHQTVVTILTCTLNVPYGLYAQHGLCCVSVIQNSTLGPRDRGRERERDDS